MIIWLAIIQNRMQRSFILNVRYSVKRFLASKHPENMTVIEIWHDKSFILFSRRRPISCRSACMPTVDIRTSAHSENGLFYQTEYTGTSYIKISNTLIFIDGIFTTYASGDRQLILVCSTYSSGILGLNTLNEMADIKQMHFFGIKKKWK